MSADPIQVTATLRGPIALPNGPIALDGLLAYAVCVRDGLPTATSEAELVPIEIPIERSTCGRFHLCTSSIGDVEIFEHRFVNRRFPLGEAQAMGNAKVRSINLQGGPCKSYRLPLATQHMVDDRLTWWAIGGACAVRDLLSLIHYLGKRRATGLGNVARWEVERCAPWGEGFPVMRNGLPMRPLPADHPGLSVAAELAYKVLTYPYWRHAAAELCAVPA